MMQGETPPPPPPKDVYEKKLVAYMYYIQMGTITRTLNVKLMNSDVVLSGRNS